jgi:uncharacterized protein (DUF1330 family)
MVGYLFVELDYEDSDWVEAYRREVPPLIAARGGRYLARTTRTELLEGDRPPSQITAILEFPSLDDAKSFLASPQYRPFADARRAAGARTRILGLA